jgi:pantoate--beta-alanine ligase
MIIAKTVAELRAHVRRWRGQNQRVSFVPTMGNLHAGHLRLTQVARDLSDVVAASIFVNPMQFGANEDLASYPRTPVEDVSALEDQHVDLLFVPSVPEVYPRGLDAMTKVEVPALGEILCGAFRPGHFRGVTTVVNRLFNLVQPDLAVFGKKDYQQLLLIRLMAEDLGMPVEIVGVDTVREGDGLAMSSRNNYLSASERALAPTLYAALRAAGDRLKGGTVPAEAQAQAMETLTAAGFRPDYVSVRRQADLAPPRAPDRELVVLAAAWLGRTRLIDNLELTLPRP